MEIKPIATIENDFETKFCIPRQSGIANIKSKIIFKNEYAFENAIRGIDGYSHLWLIWGFSENVRKTHSLTVRPPRLGGNKRVGVFATRSPFRPNNLGLSSVKLEEIIFNQKHQPILIVSGADLMNQTPIYDIKPYISYTDAHPDALGGFTDNVKFQLLNVEIASTLMNKIPAEKRETLITILKNNPVPAYQNNENRTYGFPFAGFEIKFKIKEGTLFVVSIENES